MSWILHLSCLRQETPSLEMALEVGYCSAAHSVTNLLHLSILIICSTWEALSLGILLCLHLLKDISPASVLSRPYKHLNTFALDSRPSLASIPALALIPVSVTGLTCLHCDFRSWLPPQWDTRECEILLMSKDLSLSTTRCSQISRIWSFIFASHNLQVLIEKDKNTAQPLRMWVSPTQKRHQPCPF